MNPSIFSLHKYTPHKYRSTKSLPLFKSSFRLAKSHQFPIKSFTSQRSFTSRSCYQHPKPPTPKKIFKKDQELSMPINQGLATFNLIGFDSSIGPFKKKLKYPSSVNSVIKKLKIQGVKSQNILLPNVPETGTQQHSSPQSNEEKIIYKSQPLHQIIEDIWLLTAVTFGSVIVGFIIYLLPYVIFYTFPFGIFAFMGSVGVMLYAAILIFVFIALSLMVLTGRRP